MTTNQDQNQQDRYQMIVESGAVEVIDSHDSDKVLWRFEGRNRLVQATDAMQAANRTYARKSSQAIPGTPLAVERATLAGFPVATSEDMPDGMLAVVPTQNEAHFLAEELPAFAAWQRDRTERLTDARIEEEQALAYYVKTLKARLAIELERPPAPAVRTQEATSQPFPQRTTVGRKRCSCGVSAGLPHDCETAGRIS